jgi:hypothetical protein
MHSNCCIFLLPFLLCEKREKRKKRGVTEKKHIRAFCALFLSPFFGVGCSYSLTLTYAVILKKKTHTNAIFFFFVLVAAPPKKNSYITDVCHNQKKNCKK